MSLVWTFICPRCRTLLAKEHLGLPWVCAWCGWRSDQEEEC